jgi:hypothetical protein
LWELICPRAHLGRASKTKRCTLAGTSLTRSSVRGDSNITAQESQKDHTVDRFIGVTENLDDRLKKSTVGLVTLSDFQKAKDDLEEAQRQAAARTAADHRYVPHQGVSMIRDVDFGSSSAVVKTKKGKKREKLKLSFAEDEEEEPFRPKRTRTEDDGELVDLALFALLNKQMKMVVEGNSRRTLTLIHPFCRTARGRNESVSREKNCEKNGWPSKRG